MKQNLQHVPLNQIMMLGNYRDVEPVSEKDPDIIELAASIKENKVMQAILLRPAKKPVKKSAPKKAAKKKAAAKKK